MSDARGDAALLEHAYANMLRPVRKNYKTFYMVHFNATPYAQVKETSEKLLTVGRHIRECSLRYEEPRARERLTKNLWSFVGQKLRTDGQQLYRRYQHEQRKSDMFQMALVEPDDDEPAEVTRQRHSDIVQLALLQTDDEEEDVSDTDDFDNDDNDDDSDENDKTKQAEEKPNAEQLNLGLSLNLRSPNRQLWAQLEVQQPKGEAHDDANNDEDDEPPRTKRQRQEGAENTKKTVVLNFIADLNI